MKRILLAAAILGVAAGPSPEPAPLSVTISADPTVELGKAPAIKVAIKNLTGRETLLVGSLDGSDCGMRFPHCRFEVIGPDGKSAVRGIGRCGNTNPIREKDIVRVKAGAVFDPFQRVDDGGFFSAHQIRADNFAAEGVYKIRFHYSTAEKSNSRFNGGLEGGLLTPAVSKKLDGVPRVAATSNEITVRVVKPKAK